jgi:hypothetical protein
MFNRHKQNIEKLNTHLNGSGLSEQPLSTAAYVDEVNRHLTRIRRLPLANIPRRV